MNQKEITSLFSYILNNRTRLEDEKRQLQSNIVFCDADSLDCIKFIRATERLKTFKKFTKDILLLLELDNLIGGCYVCRCCEYCRNFDACKKISFSLVVCQKDSGNDDYFCYGSCRKCMDDYRIEKEKTGE